MEVFLVCKGIARWDSSGDGFHQEAVPQNLLNTISGCLRLCCTWITEQRLITVRAHTLSKLLIIGFSVFLRVSTTFLSAPLCSASFSIPLIPFSSSLYYSLTHTHPVNCLSFMVLSIVRFVKGTSGNYFHKVLLLFNFLFIFHGLMWRF